MSNLHIHHLILIDSFIHPSIHPFIHDYSYIKIELRTYIYEEKPRGSVGANNPSFGAKTLGLGLAWEWHRSKPTSSQSLSSLRASKSFGCAVTHR